jgi:hypothetical protein
MKSINYQQDTSISKSYRQVRGHQCCSDCGGSSLPKMERCILRRTILSVAPGRSAPKPALHLTSQSPFAVISTFEILVFMWSGRISLRCRSRASTALGLPWTTLCLQYQASNSDFLARIVDITLERASQPPQDNDRTGCIRSTQCYARRLAVKCHSIVHVFVYKQQYQEHPNNASSAEIDRKPY